MRAGFRRWTSFSGSYGSCVRRRRRTRRCWDSARQRSSPAGSRKPPGPRSTYSWSPRALWTAPARKPPPTVPRYSTTATARPGTSCGTGSRSPPPKPTAGSPWPGTCCPAPGSPASPSRSATIITQALGRVRPVCDAETAARMEHDLTRTAIERDPDFVSRVARRWMDGIDQDGAEPSEEVLRQLQGAFIRKPRHGLQHLEIFATTEQFEHLLTVMNTATNPRTTTAAAGADGGDARADAGGDI